MAVRTVSASRLVSLLGSAADLSPAYRGIADGVRLLIADGRVPPGTRLPSERDLTTALDVSRTTVTRAYAELRDRGYLTSRRGSGSLATLPGSGLPGSGLPGSGTAAAAASLLSPLDQQPGDQQGGLIDLTCASPTAPPGTAAAFESALEELPRYLSGTGYHPAGIQVLREAIAQRFTDRGLHTAPDQIVVTSGALAAISVVARAHVGIGDRVLMESPTYPNAIAAMRRPGGRTVGVTVEPTGWDTDSVEAALRQTAPKVAMLIPDFHNPTGALMDDDQRSAIGRALTRTRTAGLVDETLVDMALEETDMPAPMAAYALGTITIGSASKSFWGGLRIGWLRAPQEQVGALTEARLSLDLGAPVLEQLVLSHLLGRRDELLAHRRQTVRAARDALVEAVRRQLPDWRFAVPPGGLALWCELPAPLSSALCAAAERQGVWLAPGPRFAVETGLERYIRLPYTLGPDLLTEAVARIAVAWQEAQRQRSTSTRRNALVA